VRERPDVRTGYLNGYAWALCRLCVYTRCHLLLDVISTNQRTGRMQALPLAFLLSCVCGKAFRRDSVYFKMHHVLACFFFFFDKNATMLEFQEGKTFSFAVTFGE